MVESLVAYVFTLPLKAMATQNSVLIFRGTAFEWV